ncbi:hypothetical protein AGABI2DRAFT_239474 [Agaricus bisporus var. bisporus H97]|uniref:hypothetical protein n=1 Tax=Agaricus bisporus var. bisporus (strain H97 / ATCC MYA-4626 / FGSC 10389) TaxID=936046 RepID=UPI00029F7A4B|nr:hypothetical protein AGABI2DRAFT_239474 [Agaricus bisporus var. bisporus H97]EKV52017.1 hypothetical protein AGABI2DRAFT_239474 [Agaricus bisporus var. bisporus H97]
MPVPGFLASFADKAQSAINATPLAAHLPSRDRPSSPDPSTQPPANTAAAQGGGHRYAFESISHQFRSLGQQYSSTTPAQKIVTTEKGVALHFDSVGRDSKAQSKELYTWGQAEAEDLKDVTDRLAYLNFVQGTLTATLASKLDAARSPFKALRDAETAIAPSRTARTGLQTQISRLEHDVQKSQDRKLLDLREQLRRAEMEDAGQEHEIEALKRKAVKESERLKWEAIREYGEKLVLLSQAATPIIAVLPSAPPTPELPYTGAQTTGATRASLQRALDNYKTGHISLPPQLAASELSRSDTRSFGESHAHELSALASASPVTQPFSPPQSHTSVPQGVNPQSHMPVPQGVNPQSHMPVAQGANPQSPLPDDNLNHSPAAIPFSPPAVSDPSQMNVPIITPTVAETGIPVSAGASGPGPASGSLRDLHPSPLAGGPASQHETIEEEKRRLESAYSNPAAVQGQTSQAPPAAYESAEEEKKRLEREARERLLRQASSQSNQGKKDGDDELPPSYQDI